ncbi:MAG: DUF3307 domain-containing protein [Paenibacillaceae bacterium]
MVYNLIYVFILGHLISSFCLQGRRWFQGSFRYYAIYNWTVQFVVAGLLVFYFFKSNLSLIIATLVISILHGIVGFPIRSNLFAKESRIVLFVVTQFIHLIIILVGCYYLVQPYSITAFMGSIYEFFFIQEWTLTNDERIIGFGITGVVLLFCCSEFINHLFVDLKRTPNRKKTVRRDYPSNQHQQSLTSADQVAASMDTSEISRQSMEMLGYNTKGFSVEETIEITTKLSESNKEIKHKFVKNSLDNSIVSARKGTYIGMLERLLIVILVVKGAYTAIAFVGALKTLTRFKQFDEKDFAEEYLIGTMISALFALICGHIILKII